MMFFLYSRGSIRRNFYSGDPGETFILSITQFFCGLSEFSLWSFGLQQVAMHVVNKFFPTVISVPVHDMDEPYIS